MESQPPSHPTPDAGALFLGYLGVAVSGFGGVMPFARRMLVDEKAWLSAESFNETLALCQSLPGPNIVNLAIVTGARFAGRRGALAALSGLVLAPMIIVIVLAALYGRFAACAPLQRAVTALAAAAAGLLVATAAKMAAPLAKRRPVSAGGFMLAAFGAVALLRLPLPWVLAVLAPLSVAAAWRLRV